MLDGTISNVALPTIAQDLSVSSASVVWVVNAFQLATTIFIVPLTTYGDIAGFARVRSGAWDWFQKYPLANNVWVGYFEDVPPTMENMNQVIPLEFARYVLLHPEKDPQWREHAQRLIEWVKTTPKWPKYVVHGAMVTTEQ